MTSDMSRKLQFMLCDLEINQLQTILVPSKRHDRREWDQIRVNVSVNCPWYKSFCASFKSGRKNKRPKHDTLIKRQHVLSALNRLLSGKPKGTIYENRILDVARGIKL